MKKSISVFIFALGVFALLSFVTQSKKNDPVNEGTSKELTTATTTGGVFDPNPQFRDRIYKNENASNSIDPNQSEHRRVIPYTSLRHADVTFEKRVWRMIDLKEKINQPMMFPKQRTQNRVNFFEMVMEGITTEQIHAFGDDEFLVPYTKDEAMKKATRKVFRNEIDSASGDVVGQTEVLEPLYGPDGDVTRVTRIQLKEDWYFDKQLSELDVRILAIGFEWWDESKEVERPIFWLYYPECRQLFSRYEVFNPKNDAERRTYEDLIWKRMFNSKIVKETNIYDRSINNYLTGLDALLEAEKIKNDMYKWEHDLWHF